MNEMRNFVDDIPMNFPCPECGKEVKMTAGTGRQNRKVRCPNGHSIEVDGTKLDKGLRRVEKAFTDMTSKFR